MTLSFFVLIFCVVTIGLAVITWSRRRQWIRVAYATVFAICYPIDLLVVLSAREIFLSPTIIFPLNDPFISTGASFLVLTTWLLFLAGIVVIDGGKKTKQASLIRSWAPRRHLLVLITLLLSAVIISRVLSVGIESALAHRQTVFGADVLSLCAYYALPPLVAFCVISMARASALSALLLLTSAAIASIAVFLTGSRSGLLLSCVIPLLLLAWRRLGEAAPTVGRDLTRVSLAVFAVFISIAGGGWYISEFRGAQATSGFFASADLSQADVLSALMSNATAPQGGSSYLAGVTTLIPRSIWPDKPLPANVLTSMELTPDRYLLTGAETTAGVLGEAFINFGLFSAPVAAAVLLLIVSTTERLSRSRDVSVWLLASILAVRGINIIRGDLANFAAPALITILAWLLIFRRDRAARTSVDGQGSVRTSRGSAERIRSATAD